MRIAHITFTEVTRDLCRALRRRGHTLKILCSPELGACNYWSEFDCSYVDWRRWKYQEVFKFDPDVVILWNGYADDTNAGTAYLKQHFKVLHVENGWLPQAGNLYIAEDLACHDANFIPLNMTESECASSEELNAIKLSYPEAIPETLPEKYIFIPLQLDGDSALTRSSPMFKGWDIVDAALELLPKDVNLIVKEHPKQRKISRPSGVEIYDGPLSSIQLAANATAVLGINSTVLVESLLYNKFVVAFGKNVGIRCQIDGSKIGIQPAFDMLLKKYRDFYCPDTTLNADLLLRYLLRKQFRYNDVPVRVCEYVERFKKRVAPKWP